MLDSNLSQIQNIVNTLTPVIQSELDSKDSTIATNTATIADLNKKLNDSNTLIDNLVTGSKLVTFYSGLQNPTGWVQPSNTGNTGGASSAPHGTFTLTSLPDGSTNFTINPGSPYDTYYFYKKLPFDPSIVRVAWEGTIKVDAVNLSKSQAIEWEFEQSEDGWAYNGGFQILLKTDGVRPGSTVADFSFVSKWQTIPVPIDVTQFPNGISFITEYEIDRTTKSCLHKAITINGQRFLVNKSAPGKQKNATGVNYLHYAFQLDSDGKAEPYTVNCYGMALRTL